MKRTNRYTHRRTIVAAGAAVLSVNTAVAAISGIAHADDRGDGKPSGRYQTGDFHNHTTCSDGTISVQKLVDKSARTFGLDWFVQAGHGGNSARNCTLAEDPFEPVKPALNLTVPPTIPSTGQDAATGKGPNQTWVSTLPNGEAGIKGDSILQNGVRSMWKWQMIQEFIYPVIEQESRDRGKPIFVGLEQNVPGHEHCSTAVIDGQLPARGRGDASAMAEFEYCFDRSDTDRSRGAQNQWDCSVPGSSNNNLVDASAKKIIVASGDGSGTAGHVKAVEGVKWMAAFSPDTSYYVPAHLERAGAFNPNGNSGYNIEHLRDFNNAAPEIAFGFESMPGHQADPSRGSYSTSAVGGGTYGGCGVYAAAIGGVWDALLGEGRNWYFFASSDYHNRGSFGPDQLETNADFFPGEYTKDYVAVAKDRGNRDQGRDSDRYDEPNGNKGKGNGNDKNHLKYGPDEIVDGLRSGNSFVVNGDLIDRLSFVACTVKNGKSVDFEDQIAAASDNGDSFYRKECAGMGETLSVRSGDDVVVEIVARDPQGKNNSPYSFANPSLKQINITQPLNQPVLDHIDLISGKITAKIDPSDTAHYAGLLGSAAATNPSAALTTTFNAKTWKSNGNGSKRMSYRISAIKADQYVRLRGTNLPPATPFETDSQGNPLLDFGSQGKIACSDAACPAHLTKDANGAKTSSFDVAAWSDLWFYSNPISIRVKK